MPVQGNLVTMSLTEILQWLGNAGKTGTLSIERNKVVKRILVREGRVIACASQEPSDMLGHFLVSRGKISEETLRHALAQQETQKVHLGTILVASGALTEPELRVLLEVKAQESIFGLFDWDDAEFRFTDGETDDPNIFAVNMRVEDILLRGAQRWDEMQRFRTVFNDPGSCCAAPSACLRPRCSATGWRDASSSRSTASAPSRRSCSTRTAPSTSSRSSSTSCTGGGRGDRRRQAGRAEAPEAPPAPVIEDLSRAPPSTGRAPHPPRRPAGRKAGRRPRRRRACPRGGPPVANGDLEFARGC
jgi:hypothetical protein